MPPNTILSSDEGAYEHNLSSACDFLPPHSPSHTLPLLPPLLHSLIYLFLIFFLHSLSCALLTYLSLFSSYFRPVLSLSLLLPYSSLLILFRFSLLPPSPLPHFSFSPTSLLTFSPLPFFLLSPLSSLFLLSLLCTSSFSHLLSIHYLHYFFLLHPLLFSFLPLSLNSSQSSYPFPLPSPLFYHSLSPILPYFPFFSSLPIYSSSFLTPFLSFHPSFIYSSPSFSPSSPFILHSFFSFFLFPLILHPINYLFNVSPYLFLFYVLTFSYIYGLPILSSSSILVFTRGRLT